MADEAIRIKVDADTTDAVADIRSLDDLLDSLTDEQAEIVLGARADKARAEIRQLTKEVANLDDAAEIQIRTEGIQSARSELDSIEKAAQDRDIELKVDLDTTEARGALDSLVESAGSLPGPLGDAAGLLGGAGAGLGIAGGLAAAAGAAVALAGSAATAAEEVGQISSLLGSTPEEASRVRAAFDRVGVETNDILDIVLQVNGVLTDSPELAEQLGVTVGGSPLTNFLAVADATEEVGNATERAAIQSSIYGEEGVRQVAKLTSRYGSLQAALEDVSDEQLLSQGDVDNALEYQKSMAELQATFQQLAVELGEKLVPILTDVSDFLNDLPQLPDWMTEGVDTSFLDPVTRAFGGLNGEIEYAKGLWNGLFGGGGSDEALQSASERFQDVGGSAHFAAEGAAALAAANDTAFDSTAALTGAVDEAATALEEQAAEAQTNAEALLALADAAREYAGNVLEVGEAQTAWDEALGDSESSAAELRDASIELVAAQVAAAEANALASDSALSARASFDLETDALLRQAAAVDGEARAAIVNYVGDLARIDESVETEILALLDQGRLAEAQDLLSETSESREAIIEAQAETNAAEADLDKAAELRSVELEADADTQLADAEIGAFIRKWEQRGITLHVYTTGTSGPSGGSSGGGTAREGRAATVPAARAGTVEQLSEEPGDFGTPTNGFSTAAPGLAVGVSSAATTVINVTQYLPQGVDPLAVVTALRRAQRREGNTVSQLVSEPVHVIGAG